MQVMSHFAAKQVLYLFRVKPYLTASLLVVVPNNGFQLTSDLHGSNDVLRPWPKFACDEDIVISHLLWWGGK
uniref:Uncharacterized protein n=1 Tax=Triticum urartu TaxID=4572 RepID=A0A8R7UHZ0_TRIUA